MSSSKGGSSASKSGGGGKGNGQKKRTYGGRVLRSPTPLGNDEELGASDESEELYDSDESNECDEDEDDEGDDHGRRKKRQKTSRDARRRSGKKQKRTQMPKDVSSPKRGREAEDNQTGKHAVKKILVQVCTYISISDLILILI